MESSLETQIVMTVQIFLMKKKVIDPRCVRLIFRVAAIYIQTINDLFTLVIKKTWSEADKRRNPLHYGTKNSVDLS